LRSELSGSKGVHGQFHGRTVHRAGFDDLILPMSLLQPRELQIVGIFRYANTWPAAIDLVRSGRVALAPLVTSHIGLADSPAVLSRAAPDPGEVKTVVLPQQ
jgi:L-iditol 2-dehydrogenase